MSLSGRVAPICYKSWPIREMNDMQLDHWMICSNLLNHG